MKFLEDKTNNNFYFISCTGGNIEHEGSQTTQASETGGSLWVTWAPISTWWWTPLLDFKLCGRCRLPGVLWGQRRKVRQSKSTYIYFLLCEWTVKPVIKAFRLSLCSSDGWISHSPSGILHLPPWLLCLPPAVPPAKDGNMISLPFIISTLCLIGVSTWVHVAGRSLGGLSSQTSLGRWWTTIARCPKHLACASSHPGG